MLSAQEDQNHHAMFHVIISNVGLFLDLQPVSSLVTLLILVQYPAEFDRLPESENWKPLKDRMRIIMEEGDHVDYRTHERSIPKIVSKGGLAWCEFRSYAEAIKIYGENSRAYELKQRLTELSSDIMQGHQWDGCILEAWLAQQEAGAFEPLLGPINNATGSIRLPHGRQSTVMAAILQMIHQQSSHQAPSMLQPTFSNCNLRAAQINVPVTPRAPGRSIYGPTSFPFSYPAGVYASQYQHGEDSPVVPISPDLSNSSRNSSISTLSTTTMLHDLPTHPAISALRTTPYALTAPVNSTRLSRSSVLRTEDRSQRISQAPTPSPSISGSTSQSSISALSPTECHKVTITNLSLQATKEVIGELVEQKTRRYVTLVQPNPIRLRSRRGQLHAYVSFVEKDDAERAVQQIRGFRFMGRQLHAILETAGG